MTDQVQPKAYQRFTASQRFEHMVLLVTFSGLALTGLPQKFAAQAWAQQMIALMGGIESVRIIHRVLATILMAECIYHGGVITYKLFVLGRRATMLPGLRDLRDVRDWILFNLGLKAEHPHLPRYNFGEKAEYLAVVWGTVVMVITGFMLWNPIATTRVLPGTVIPAARSAHSNEALLAVLAIVIWHMYNVHIKRFNRSMFTGKLAREAMEEEHGEELAAIEQGVPQQPEIPEEIIARRHRRFWPYAIVVTITLTVGLILFITFEDSAIQTIPRREVQVFAPNIEIIEGDPVVGASLWPTLRCAMCHGDKAGGMGDAPALQGTDLTFDDFYQQVREGAGEMPAFGPGEIPDAYLLHLWAWLTEPAEAQS
jgi:cytochrome b subunit of formate dehydrogenase